MPPRPFQSNKTPSEDLKEVLEDNRFSEDIKCAFRRGPHTGPKDKGLISKKWEWLWSNDIDNESIHKKSTEFLKYLYQLGLKRIEMVLIK